VAIIGAGGIGFDVAEYLLHYNNKDKRADEIDVDEFLRDWGVDKKIDCRGGLHQICSREKISNTPSHSREIILMQRKKGKLGKALGKTTGWVHRTNLTKSKAVIMYDGVQYDMVDENGNLHITIAKEKQKKVIEVDNIILCAGQLPNNDIEKEADFDTSRKIYSIGGAYEALELDAKRAINMGTRLALKLSDKSVFPGEHIFEASPSAGEKIYHLINRMK